MHVLIETECAGSPLPSLARLALEGDFFGDGVDALLLLDGVGIHRREVLIHEHAVVQVLESGHGIEDEVVCLMLDVEAGVQEATAIRAFLVVGNLTEQVRTVFLTLELAGIIIRIATLVGIVVSGGKVYLPIRRRQPDGTDASASGLHVVHLLVEERVGKESVRSFVITACREGKLLAHTMIVGEGCTTMVVS